jgi:hypothetical protein
MDLSDRLSRIQQEYDQEEDQDYYNDRHSGGTMAYDYKINRILSRKGSPASKVRSVVRYGDKYLSKKKSKSKTRSKSKSRSTKRRVIRKPKTSTTQKSYYSRPIGPKRPKKVPYKTFVKQHYHEINDMVKQEGFKGREAQTQTIRRVAQMYREYFGIASKQKNYYDQPIGPEYREPEYYDQPIGPEYREDEYYEHPIGPEYREPEYYEHPIGPEYREPTEIKQAIKDVTHDLKEVKRIQNNAITNGDYIAAAQIANNVRLLENKKDDLKEAEKETRHITTRLSEADKEAFRQRIVDETLNYLPSAEPRPKYRRPPKPPKGYIEEGVESLDTVFITDPQTGELHEVSIDDPRAIKAERQRSELLARLQRIENNDIDLGLGSGLYSSYGSAFHRSVRRRRTTKSKSKSRSRATRRTKSKSRSRKGRGLYDEDEDYDENDYGGAIRKRKSKSRSKRRVTRRTKSKSKSRSKRRVTRRTKSKSKSRSTRRTTRRTKSKSKSHSKRRTTRRTKSKSKSKSRVRFSRGRGIY